MFHASIKLLLFSLMAVSVLLNGCSATPKRNPVPAGLEQEAELPGISDTRFWGDDIPTYIEERMRAMTKEEVRDRIPALFGNPHNYLAISGGGAEGAFGAGLLVGWTEAGNRPEFQVITGVSTGALIAPWAYLGRPYDQTLKEIYTTITTKDIVSKSSIITGLFSSGDINSVPLMMTIRRYVDDQVINDIAKEYRKGRRLFMGTTDLDHMRPRIWDIGAIASSGHPDAKELVHKIMFASASIPGAFPPVLFEVEADGKIYDEIHVDGGVTSQVFVYPAAVDWGSLLKELEVPGVPNIYIIRNSKLNPERKEVEPKIIPMAMQSISSLIRTQGIGDLLLIYMLARRDGGNYRLAYIPADFDEKPKEPFDNAYMNKLFELGYESAKKGYPWIETPPGWEDEGGMTKLR